MEPSTKKHKSYRLEKLFGRILDPFEKFLKQTTSGGIVLLVTALITLAWANSPLGLVLDRIREYPLQIILHEWRLSLSLHQFINEGMMSLFFLLVGLELKRAFIVGDLSSVKRAALPIVGAVGGMVVPALIYFAINPSGTPAAGWGIPTATDIAFAVSILVMLARRVPRSLIVFLTALAIADDLGAVLIIALFYTQKLNFVMLGFAASAMVLLIILNMGGIRRILPYGMLGILLWYCLLESGIHSTIAGVLLAFVIPARPVFTSSQFARRLDDLRQLFHFKREELKEIEDPLVRVYRMETVAACIEEATHTVQSPLQRLEHGLAPLVTFIVIPLFALVNAGIDFSKVGFSYSYSVTTGVILGLVFGKFLGISGLSWLAIRLGIAQLPPGTMLKQVFGAAWLGGIGFTMSIFISELAFHDNPFLIESAKVGILIASPIASIVGLGWLYFASFNQERR